MPSLAAALLVGLTAMAAIVPGAEGPAPRPAAPTSDHPFGTAAAGLHRTVAEHGPHIVERFFGRPRASLQPASDPMPAKPSRTGVPG